jgi:hypothetical protein
MRNGQKQGMRQSSKWLAQIKVRHLHHLKIIKSDIASGLIGIRCSGSQILPTKSFVL